MVGISSRLPRAADFDAASLGASPRIVVVVRDHMSGVLYSVPTLRALKQRWPDARITLVTNAYSAPILSAGTPYTDQVLPLFTFSDEPTRFDRLGDLVRKAGTWLRLVGRVDLVVHLRDVGGGSLAFFASLGRPPQVAYTQDRFNEFLSLNVGPQDVELGSRQRNQLILDDMGVPSDGHRMELWVDEADRTWAREWLQDRGHLAGQRVTVVHPGSHWGCNQWLVPSWQSTIREVLAADGGVVVITGVERERRLAEQIAADIPGAKVAAGETSLGQFAALIEQSDLVLAIDAAPTQICQALDVPAVVLMGAGNPAWNGPVEDERMVLLQEWDNDNPRPEVCDWAAGACNGPQCQSRLEAITVRQVLDAIETVVTLAPRS